MLRAILVTLVLLVAAPAGAPAKTITTTTGDAKLSALGGWLVWSEPDGDAWRLVALKEGSRRTFPVPERPKPFDVDLGTDGRGRVVATYTRCTTYPSGVQGEIGGGCEIRVLDLASGRERAAAVPLSPGASVATPSMQHGRIAYSQTAPAHPDVMRVRVWAPTTRKLTRLPLGPLPKNGPNWARVLDVDLGDRLLTYRWKVNGYGIAGAYSTVVLAAELPRTRTVMLGSGGATESACAGDLNSSVPLAPTAVGLSVWYLQFAEGCSETFSWMQRGGVNGKVGQASGPNATLEGTTDGRWFYLLVAQKIDPDARSPIQYRCDLPGAPCLIRRVHLPKGLRPLAYKPHLETNDY